MLRIQYFVTERKPTLSIFDNGKTTIHLATMDKVRAEVKLENLKKVYPRIADNFKIERKLIFMK